MAFVDDTQRSALLTKAVEALSSSDNAHSLELYRDVVQTITRLCNKNQKEIANELQQLAKAIEEQGKVGEAFEFKQRTCAVMLELSMEERRRAKLGMASPPVTTMHHGSSTGGAVVQTAEPSTSGETAPSTSSPGAARVGVDTIELEPFNREAQSTAGEAVASATAGDTGLPFINVEYLYIGSNDYERDLAYYRDVLLAQEVWKFDRFGSRITAFSLSAGPLILLADSRRGPSCQPVFRVADLATSARELGQRGWKPSAGPFGTPNGEAYSFEDPSGNKFAIFQVDETSTDRAYYDPTEGE